MGSSESPYAQSRVAPHKRVNHSMSLDASRVLSTDTDEQQIRNYEPTHRYFLFYQF